MRYLFFFIILFFLIFSFPLLAQGGSYYGYHDYFLVNNVFSLLSLHEREFAPLNLSEDFIYDRKKETGYRMEGDRLYFGIIFLQVQQINSSSSTLFFMDEFFAKRDHLQDEYQVRLYEVKQTLSGFTLGGDFLTKEEWALRVGGGIKYLQGDDFRYRDYEGSVSSQNPSYQLFIQRDSAYSGVARKSQIVEDKMKSTGYSLDVQISWQPTSNLLLQFTAENLYSRIIWQDVFTVRGTYDTNNLMVDEEGYFFYVPIFGPNSYWTYADYETSLMKEYDLSLTLKEYLSLGLFYRQSLFPYFLIHLNPFQLELTAGLIGDMARVALGYQGLSLNVASSHLSPAKSTNFLFYAGWQIPF